MSLSNTSAVLQHNEQREIEAIGRKSTGVEGKSEGDWLLRMPFAGLGMSNVRLSLGEMFNFAMTVAALDPAPGDLVLDLGAGSCWVSDWLNRLLVDTVSLDIAHDMLMIGQRRLAPGAKQTVGKFQVLPFADETFDGAICLSALHHVPDIQAALREIHRVLKTDGAVVFSEPGIGHSAHPQSQSEMAECGVMERDIVVNELLDECLKAGFRDVSVRPYLFPPPTYAHGMWQAIDRAGQPLIVARSGLRSAVAWSRSLIKTLGRPAWARCVAAAPALHRLTPTMARVAGQPASGERGGDPGQPPESILAWESLLTFRNAVRVHPVVIVRKEPRRPDSRRPHILNAEISISSAPLSIAPGATFTVVTQVRNTGDTLWLHTPTPIGGHVALGAKLLDANGLAEVMDFGRGYLSRSVQPGETLPVEITLTAPTTPGGYQVKLDMVDECFAWFEHHGARPAVAPLEVTPH